MKRIGLSLLIMAIVISNVSAQDCNCKESFKWMINIIENNDAGFQYIIDKKGIEDYKKHTALFEDKSKNAISVDSCQYIMNQWLKYFRPGHIGVSKKENNTKVENPQKIDAEIRLQFKNEKTIDLTQENLIAHLESKKDRNPIEGIWINGNYTIGIIGDTKTHRKFTAFIIEADSIYWLPKQVKAEFSLNTDNRSYTVDYLMRDHSKIKTEATFVNDSNSILNVNNTIWLRKDPKVSLSKKDEIFLSFIKSSKPFVEKLSEKTVYLRIPSFERGRKKEIDDILTKYNDLIISTPNLIIDIRNGTGGSDNSYSNILPYLYTNPFRIVGIDIYSTELNANEFENYSKMSTDTSKINFYHQLSNRMKANIGKYISLFDKPFEVYSLDKVLPYPKKVAIICNQHNGSADEQFLMTAKQSYKVKVFGKPTHGALDISNLNEIDFPNGKFKLSYGMSRSYRIPSYCIDGVGIQPDFFIDDAIPEYDWVEYTKTKLEE